MSDSPILDQATAALARARDLPALQQIIRTGARRLVQAQGATLVLLEQGKCFYADEDAISPLWKGQRFPVDECISGWAMLHHRPAVIRDIRLDPRIPQETYRPTFVRSLLMVPIRPADPLGAIGAYWSRPYQATAREVALLESLAEGAAGVLARLRSGEREAVAGGLRSG